MSIFGVTAYGTDYYGLGAPGSFLSEPMTASASNYSSVLVTWTRPTNPDIYRYRLVTSLYGFPVNQDDGNILIDSATYPGSYFIHSPVVPGRMNYYSIYVLAVPESNIWIRSGVAATLSVANFGSAQWMLDRIPEYFKTLPANGGELGGPASGDTYLDQFLLVLGWGADYLKTQYALAAQHMNDPLAMPLDELLALGQQFGLKFGPEIEASTIRKAVANASHAYRERGTYLGLRNEITLYTGWSADVLPGVNLVLEDDQAQFLDPIFLPYTGSQTYLHGDLCWYDPDNAAPPAYGWAGTGGWYECIVPTSYGVRPLGDSLSSTNWAVITDTNDFLSTLTNSNTGNPNTWEGLNLATSNGMFTGSLTQGLGVANVTGTGTAWNSLRLINGADTTQTLAVRSVSRSSKDLELMPDPGFEAGFTVINAASVPKPTWIDPSWPVVMVPMDGYPGQRNNPGRYNASAFWTAATMDLALTTTYQHTGARSMICTPTSTSAPFCRSPYVRIDPGQTADVTLYLYCHAALTKAVSVAIAWCDQHGNNFATSTAVTTTLSPGDWAEVSVSATAPDDTKYAWLRISLPTGCALTDVFCVDDIEVSTGLEVALTFAPDQINAVQDGIPVPWVRDSQLWTPLTTYHTGDLVDYQGQAFVALRASTGVIPASLNETSNEWAPIGFDRRVRLAISGYTSQDMTNEANLTTPVTPFVEWYDVSGNYLGRVFARSPSGTARPNNLAFDSFTQPSAQRAGTVDISSWQGAYYGDTNVTGNPLLLNNPTSLDFSWWSCSPGPGVPDTGWSAQWTTIFTAPESATYTFGVASADGSRIYVNGALIVDNWNTQPMVHATGSIWLNWGQQANVVVQYYKFLSTPENKEISYDFSTADLQGWAGISQVQVAWDSRGQLYHDTFMGLTSGTAVSPMQAVTPLSTITATAELTFDHPGASSGQNAQMIGYLLWLDENYKVAQVNAGSPVSVTINGTVPVTVTGQGPENAAYCTAVFTSLNLDGLTTSTATPAWATFGEYLGVSYMGSFVELFKYDPTTGLFWPVPVNSSGQVPLVNTTTGQVVGWQNVALPTADESCQIVSAEIDTTLRAQSGLFMDPITWSLDSLNTNLAGRTTDDKGYTWLVPTGAWMTCGMAEGSAAPTTPTTRSIALITGPANTMLGVTFRSPTPGATIEQGLVFRYSDDNDYWRADQNALWKRDAGTFTQVATFATPFAVNDRMNVSLNGSAIAVFRNNVQVASATDTFNDTATSHGLIVDTPSVALTLPGTKATATAGAVAGTVHAWPAASSLIDPFSVNQFSIVWNPTTGATVTNSALNIPCKSAMTTVTSIKCYDLTSSSIYCHAGPSTGTDRELFMQLVLDSGDSIQVGYTGGSLQAQLTQGGTVSWLSAKVTYSSTAHAYWRIRESSGTVYFDVAPDGATWTSLWDAPHTMDVTRLQVAFSTGYWATDTTTTAYVYGVNTTS